MVWDFFSSPIKDAELTVCYWWCWPGCEPILWLCWQQGVLQENRGVAEDSFSWRKQCGASLGWSLRLRPCGCAG